MSHFVKIPVAQAQSLIDYLKRRPFDEVFTLVPFITNAPVVDESPQQAEALPASIDVFSPK